MKLQEFIERKRKNWDRLENLLAIIRRKKLSSLTPPEIRELSNRYRRAASELAYAQTYFPRSEITFYLNRLVGRAYQQVYQARRLTWRTAGRFFLYGYPRLFRKNLAFFFIALAIFSAAAILGFVVVEINPDAAGLLLPDRIIEKIEQQEMWTADIFNIFPPALISSIIFTNNISVTFMAFALGILAGMGTVYLLVLNGLLLGMVFSLCLIHGLGGEFLAFVLPHGLTELSLIFIAGGSGLMLGNAIISPGEYSRRESLTRGGREAVRLVLGGVPFLVAAGLVEGYISPAQDLPDWSKILLGVLLAAALFVYLGCSRPPDKSHSP